MYLKRIEIYGFKSFAQKTVLDFEYRKVGNITAVVGPNGSGKSNVADAIRWVTGEQSSKNLRSKKSEDVIFCGSAAKPRGSYAEVAIVLADEKLVKFELNGKEYSLTEIEVSRKLYRSGDSDYLINRKKVRLTDIQQLLASLGFGQSSYTVIGQGMVDRLLFFTASERKVLFDEAAGVKQYEIKREQSLKKLESTEANLVRLTDILTELEPRVVNLRRLVKRAEGRKELEAEIRQVQSRYFGALFSEYNGELKTANERKSALNKKVEQVEEALAKLEVEILATKNNPFTAEREQYDRQLNVQYRERDGLRESIAYLRGQVESAGRNEELAKAKRLSLENESLKLNDEAKENQEKIDSSKIKIAEVEKSAATENLVLKTLEGKIELLDKELASPGSDKDTARLSILEKRKLELESKKDDFSGKIYSIRQQENFEKARKEQAAVQLKSLELSLKSLEVKLAESSARLADLHSEKKDLQKLVELRDKALSNLEKKLEGAEKQLEALTAQVTDSSLKELTLELRMVRESHQEMSRRISSASSIEGLGKLKAEFTDFGTNLKKLFERFSGVVSAIDGAKREEIEQGIREFRSGQQVAAKELSEAKYQQVRVDSEIGSLSALVEDYKKQIAAKKNEISQATQPEQGRSTVDTESLNKELVAINHDLEGVNQEIRKSSGAIHERQNVILTQKNALQLEHRDQRQKVYNLEMELSRVQSSLEFLQKEQGRIESRIVVVKEELLVAAKPSVAVDKTAETELRENEAKLSKKEADIAKTRGGLVELKEKEKNFSEQGYAQEKTRRDLESQKVQLASQLSALEVDIAKNTVRLEDVESEIRASNFATADLDVSETLDQIGKDVMKLKVENLRRKLDNTASIDPETEAEYHELESRATEMATQVEDLTKAKSDLEKVVRELDERIKHQFADVFKGIASEFHRYFTMLFNGGNAKLELGEDENGSFGIEISANPPGKRVQSLSALSGGERTLTSLALLFAILSVNPSPFVVLDEVDAALDESNTMRFVKILEDLAVKTQFIIISHNRDTMKSASSLYGVTMDESHISKLLSVKLTEALAGAKS